LFSVMMENAAAAIKIVIVGDSGVGKSRDQS
jgi:GTPase SAR1 family protein